MIYRVTTKKEVEDLSPGKFIFPCLKMDVYKTIKEPHTVLLQVTLLRWPRLDPSSFVSLFTVPVATVGRVCLTTAPLGLCERVSLLYTWINSAAFHTEST